MKEPMLTRNLRQFRCYVIRGPLVTLSLVCFFSSLVFPSVSTEKLAVPHKAPELLRGPIMILDNSKGLTNQRSCALTGLHLARLLRWPVMLPTIVSPIDCEHKLACYQYSRFEPVNFDEIYDREFFVRHAARLGVTVHERIPDGYVPLPASLWPCVSHGKCRDTFDGLVDRYRNITSSFLVPAPGIAASVVDSEKAARDLAVTNQAFQHSRPIKDDAETILNELKGMGTVVAIHFRFEPDAERVNYSGDMGLFARRLVHFLEHISQQGEPFVFYLVTALSLEDVERTIAIQHVLRRFPASKLLSKHTCKSLLQSSRSPITFVSAALDFEVSLGSEYFVGFVQSSFSSFIALERKHRHRISSKLHTVMLPSLKLSDICTLRDVHTWQFELQLPFNDCFLKDPCALLMRLPEHPGEGRRCIRPANSSKSLLCTGLTGWSSHCVSGPLEKLKTNTLSDSNHIFFNSTIEAAL